MRSSPKEIRRRVLQRSLLRRGCAGGPIRGGSGLSSNGGEVRSADLVRVQHVAEVPSRRQQERNGRDALHRHFSEDAIRQSYQLARIEQQDDLATHDRPALVVHVQKCSAHRFAGKRAELGCANAVVGPEQAAGEMGLEQQRLLAVLGQESCPSIVLPFHMEGGSEDVEQACAASRLDRKSTRLNSSHLVISYAVFCLKK